MTGAVVPGALVPTPAQRAPTPTPRRGGQLCHGFATPLNLLVGFGSALLGFARWHRCAELMSPARP